MYSYAISKWEQAILGKATLELPEDPDQTLREAREITRYVCMDMLGYKDAKDAARGIDSETAGNAALELALRAGGRYYI